MPVLTIGRRTKGAEGDQTDPADQDTAAATTISTPTVSA
jgi:hypothetical protein